jgi:chitodextrinase
VDYGIANIYGQNKGDTTYATTHSVDITGLTQNTEYHFRVSGKDATNNIYSSGDLTFTPKSPPSITAVKTNSTTEHEAIISFTANVPTDALIVYTNTQNKEDTGSQGKPDLLTAHEITLKNLTSGATYSYTITAKDYDGNSSSFPETGGVAPSFTTGKDENPPKIDQVRTDSALAQNNKVQTIISWITDEPATTQLTYQEGRNGEKKDLNFGNGQFTTNHVAVITSFKSGVVYYFQVKSTDQAGNTGSSSDFALLTPKQKENIIQIIINNFTDIFGWAKFGG